MHGKEKDLIHILSKFPSFIITTHKNCDGDGLGSGFALYHGLRQLGKEVFFRTLEEPEKKYSFLDEHKILKPYSSDPLPVKSEGAVLVVDTNDSRLLNPFYDILKAKNLPVVFIDHHSLATKSKEDYFYVDTNASSTGELVYDLLKKLNISFNKDIATALYTSIAFDTKFFRHIKNSSRPFAICAELVPYILKTELIYESLFKHLKKENLGFFTYFNRMEYHHNDSIGILHLSKEDFKKYNSNVQQAYEMMETVMNISSMEMTALILEEQTGSFKLSLRSRRKSILEVAESFNGGGHKLAAGAYVTGQNLQETKNKVLSGLLKALQ